MRLFILEAFAVALITVGIGYAAVALPDLVMAARDAPVDVEARP